MLGAVAAPMRSEGRCSALPKPPASARCPLAPAASAGRGGAWVLLQLQVRQPKGRDGGLPVPLLGHWALLSIPCTVPESSKSRRELSAVIPRLQTQLLAVISLLFFWDVSCFSLACSSDRRRCRRLAPAGKPCSGEGVRGWRWKAGAEGPLLTPPP